MRRGGDQQIGFRLFEPALDRAHLRDDLCVQQQARGVWGGNRARVHGGDGALVVVEARAYLFAQRVAVLARDRVHPKHVGARAGVGELAERVARAVLDVIVTARIGGDAVVEERNEGGEDYLLGRPELRATHDLL